MPRRFTVKASKDRSRDNYVKASMARRRRVVAADEDEDFGDLGYVGDVDNVDEGFNDSLEEIQDTVEDIQDIVDGDIEEDSNIEVENNITGHLIAECEKCHGIFISATIESDQKITKVSGECPICGENTDQYLKWVVNDIATGKSEDDPDAYMWSQTHKINRDM